MIKIYKISCYFSACFCRGLLGKFLLKLDETKLSNDFYTCKKHSTERKKHNPHTKTKKTLGTTHIR